MPMVEPADTVETGVMLNTINPFQKDSPRNARMAHPVKTGGDVGEMHTVVILMLLPFRLRTGKTVKVPTAR